MVQIRAIFPAFALVKVFAARLGSVTADTTATLAVKMAIIVVNERLTIA